MAQVASKIRELKANIVRRRAEIKKEDKELLTQLRLVRQMEHTNASPNGTGRKAKAQKRAKGSKDCYTGKDGKISWAQAARRILMRTRTKKMHYGDIYDRIVEKGLRKADDRYGQNVVYFCIRNNKRFSISKDGMVTLNSTEKWW